MCINKPRRRGAVLPLTAILLIFLMGMVAFSVDLGYICMTQGQLQTAADAAALAGAAKLIKPTTQSSTSQDFLAQQAIVNAKAESIRFAKYNLAAGTYLDVLNQDILVGYQQTPSQANVTPWVPGANFPNTVQVTVQRNSNANGPVTLFFARVMGIDTWSGTATASAVYNASKYNVTGFNPPQGGSNPTLLPIAINLTSWTKFMQSGQSPDGQVHDSFTASMPTSSLAPPMNVTNGFDYTPELSGVYPDGTAPGNFGLVSLQNSKATSTPTYRDWILNGPSPDNMASFGSSGLQATPDAPASCDGGPGLKSTLVTDLAAIIGQPRTILLYSDYAGNGSNATYTIVGFAGVTVVDAVGNGSNMQITFQPLTVIDKTATTSTGSSSVSSGVYPASPLMLSR